MRALFIYLFIDLFEITSKCTIKEVEKVKNKELKISFTAKFILMKATIDTHGQLSSLTQQQKIAAGSLMDIYDKRSIGYPADVISSILIKQVVLKKNFQDYLSHT